jgi:hypothetical protein
MDVLHKHSPELADKITNDYVFVHIGIRNLDKRKLFEFVDGLLLAVKHRCMKS